MDLECSHLPPHVDGLGVPTDDGPAPAPTPTENAPSASVVVVGVVVVVVVAVAIDAKGRLRAAVRAATAAADAAPGVAVGDGVRVAARDGQARDGRGPGAPAVKSGPVGRLARTVDHPGGGVAELVEQCLSQARLVVHYLKDGESQRERAKEPRQPYRKPREKKERCDSGAVFLLLLLILGF